MSDNYMTVDTIIDAQDIQMPMEQLLPRIVEPMLAMLRTRFKARPEATHVHLRITAVDRTELELACWAVGDDDE